jgi:hypothetical protein
MLLVGGWLGIPLEEDYLEQLNNQQLMLEGGCLVMQLLLLQIQVEGCWGIHKPLKVLLEGCLGIQVGGQQVGYLEIQQHSLQQLKGEGCLEHQQPQHNLLVEEVYLEHQQPQHNLQVVYLEVHKQEPQILQVADYLEVGQHRTRIQ